VPYNYGSGRNAHCFSKALKKEGLQVTLVSLNRNLRHQFKNIFENVILYRIPYFVYNKFSKILSFPFLLFYYTFFILKSKTVLVYSTITGYEFILLACKAFRRKVIFQSNINGTDDIVTLTSKNSLTNWLNKKLFSWIDGYFAINSYFKDSYLQVYGSLEKIFLSYQGVDLNRFYAKDKEINHEHGMQILSVGLIINRKGYREIFNELQKLEIPFHYTIIGDNNPIQHHSFTVFKNEMLSIMKEGKEKLGDKITFLGTQENITRHLNNSDVFLINSKQEGTPNSILEAMACKCPVVTRNLEGLSNTLLANGEHAYVYTDGENLNEILELIYKNPLDTIEKANKAYEYVVKNADIQKVAKKFIEKFCK